MKKGIVQYMHFFFILLLITLQPCCIHRKHIAKDTLIIQQQPQEKSFSKDISCEKDFSINAPPITIWVHGTILFRKAFYQKDFFNQSGLFRVYDLPHTNIYFHIASTIAESDLLHFPLEEFYIFAWSGKLSTKERKIATKKLHKDLTDLIKDYEKKYNCYPIIRIIAHSHGGNVVLHMAKKDSLTPISIKYLVLLACPVQQKTMYLVNMPMFEHIYSLYSSIDMIQVIAPQLKNHLYRGRRNYKIPGFSSRLFPPFPHLIQAKIKLNGYPILHTHFSKKKFVSLLPTILKKLDSWDLELQKNALMHKHKLLCVFNKN